MRTSISLAFATGLLLPALHVHGQPGTLDPDFNGGAPRVWSAGTVHDNINELIALPDTTTLIFGTTNVNGATRGVVGHVLQDGSMDASWGVNSGYTYILSGASSFIYDADRDDQGRIVVCGIVSNAGVYDLMVARLLPDGTFDASFDGDGLALYSPGPADDYANGVVVDGGKIHVGGKQVITPGFTFQRALLARINDDGTVDTAWGTGGYTYFAPGTSSDVVTDVAVLSDGSLVGVGYWNNGSQDRGLMVKVDPAGQPDAAFGPGGMRLAIVGSYKSEGNSVLAEGLEFVVAGTRTGQGSDTDLYIARFDASGNAVSSFGQAGSTLVNSTVLDAGSDLCRTDAGKYLVTGAAGASTMSRQFFTVRFDPAGNIDPTWGTNGMVMTPVSSTSGFAYGVAEQPDGRVMVGGTAVFGNNNFTLVRYIGDAIITNAPGAPEEVFDLFPSPSVDGLVTVLPTRELNGAQVRVLDTHGRVVLLRIIGTGPTTLDLAAVADGLYFVEVSAGPVRAVRRVVIAH